MTARLKGLDSLDGPSKRVILTEGDSNREAVAEAFPKNAVVSQPNGAGAQSVDYSPLKGRTVTIWFEPQRPAAYRARIDRAAASLQQAGAERVRWVDATEAGGGDALPSPAQVSRVFEPKELAGIVAARALDWRPAAPPQAPDPKPAPAPVEDAPDASPLPYSHDRLAARYAALHGHELRYVAPWNGWLRWSGAVWQREDSLLAEHYARELCRAVAAEALTDTDTLTTDKARERMADKLTSVNAITAVEKLARADRRLVAPVDIWDQNLWALNTPAGLVDLKTGQLKAHDPWEYCTKQTSVAPALDEHGNIVTDCPQWLKFVAWTQDDNPERVAFLQRFMGYALYGAPIEHALVFAYGTGGNGKGTCINAITGVLGDYAATAGMDLFVQSRMERDKGPALAALRAARLVTAQETGEGARWDEQMVKQLTGGDPITACRKYEHPFTFQPQFSLFIAGNYKPSLHSVDAAIKRRLHLVPFSRQAKNPNPHLSEELREEWPGILSWLIEGCMAWQRDGLAPPEAVKAATDDYLEEQDTFGQWLAECTVQDPHATELTGKLYKAYCAYVDEAGQRPWAQNRFSSNLESRGYERRRSGGKRFFKGIRFKDDTPPDPRAYFD